jgi:hypothetical protein
MLGLKIDGIGGHGGYSSVIYMYLTLALGIREHRPMNGL